MIGTRKVSPSSEFLEKHLCGINRALRKTKTVTQLRILAILYSFKSLPCPKMLQKRNKKYKVVRFMPFFLVHKGADVWTLWVIYFLSFMALVSNDCIAESHTLCFLWMRKWEWGKYSQTTNNRKYKTLLYAQPGIAAVASHTRARAHNSV